ncbi:Glucocorticoid modulatory element-binding protein 2 [Mizuhopecten yessoensis]|uniref:Glucocorticoid modulatory element-binding protein 2 n=1 Tax=Mizuhopecten yessoensis TaxID=6573 RepID=A0A210PZ17_MIZYE|nr:Glucocorticoid modulatory element-binding protein 2 [Mizuhopecten yessoensis]
MRMREVLKPLPDDNILIVTCGSLIGNLHRDRFFCPGIHRECIEVNGTFITPKRFSVMGEKARLKDWKNAVRLNGFQLRKYIDSGILKFSNHDSMCTGRCVARAPGARSGPAADSLLPSDSKSSATRPLGMFTTLSGNNIMKIEKVPSDLSWSYENGEEEEDVKPDVNQLQFQMLQAQNMAASKASTYVRSSPTSRVAKKLAPQIYPTLITPVPMVAPDEGPEDITEEGRSCYTTHIYNVSQGSCLRVQLLVIDWISGVLMVFLQISKNKKNILRH